MDAAYILVLVAAAAGPGVLESVVALVFRVFLVPGDFVAAALCARLLSAGPVDVRDPAAVFAGSRARRSCNSF